MLNQYCENLTVARKNIRPTNGGHFDLSLYLVINPEQCVNGSSVQTALSAVKGGVTAIQLRSKIMDTPRLEAMVDDVVNALGSQNVPIFINDSVHIAAATGVNAVHLGQDDTSVEEARAVLGEKAYLGLTVRSLSEARNAPLHLLDYVSVGGVFPTRSKSNPDPPIGIDGLKRIVNLLRSRDSQLRIIAISGITTQNLESVLQCGVDGVAVVSAICESENPQLAAQAFRQRINEFNIRTNSN